MANFNSMVLTEKGQILYAKGQAGATINFTKLAVGAGDIGTTNPETLTNLVNHKFDIAIQGKTVNTLEKVALISGTLTNSNMTEPIYIQEIGLYALDPDDGEILYSYASAGEYGDYTSPASSGPYSWTYQIYAAIGNAANVNVTLSGLQYDTGIVNTNTTFSVIKGSNQKEINKSIDNKFKPYTTTNNGNVYTITSSDIDSLTDGYPILVRFNADSTGDISIIVNGSTSHDVVDYFNNKVSNVRNGLVARLVWDEHNSNFQLLGKGGEGNLTADKLLTGYYGTGNNGIVQGNMPDNGILNDSLNAGDIFNIPEGYTSGGIITANSLSSQTLATADENTILEGFTAWVNGIKKNGHATIQNLGGRKFADGTVVFSGAPVVVNLSFTPSIVIMIYDVGTTYEYDYFITGNKNLAICDGSGNLWWNPTNIVINGSSVSLYPRYRYVEGVPYTYYMIE